jgi:hypothetical protein
MKTNLFIITLSIVLITGCKNDEFTVDKDIIQVTIKNSDTYTYNTGIGGDEEGAKIIKQSKNHQKSELRRDETTNWLVIYDYQPKANFTGQDYIEIETYEGSDGASPATNIKTVKILVTVTK